MKRHNLRGHLFAMITITIWSSTFIISKILLEVLSPLQVLYCRYAIAIVFLSVIHPKFSLPKKWLEELWFLMIGASLVGYFIFENSALQRTYSSNVSLIVATIPVMTALLSMFVYKTSFFNLKGIIGFIVAYTGVAIIIINGSKLEGVEPIGDFLAFGAAVMFAIYSVVMEKIDKAIHLIRLTRKVFVYGFLVLTVVLLFGGMNLAAIKFNGGVISTLIYLGVVASSLAFIMWNDAIKQIGPVKTNQYIYLVPVVTTVMSAIVLKERITLLTIIGTIGILVGLYLTEHADESSVDDEDPKMTLEQENL